MTAGHVSTRIIDCATGSKAPASSLTDCNIMSAELHLKAFRPPVQWRNSEREIV